MAAKTPYAVDVGNNKVVVISVYADRFAALLTTLGYTALGAGGEVPTGKTKVGQGRKAALQNGCFAVNLVYAKTATKNQTAKVLVSPSKSDTVFTEAKTKTYNSKNIIEVKIPTRRVLAF